jgi:hypothetical protein
MYSYINKDHTFDKPEVFNLRAANEKNMKQCLKIDKIAAQRRFAAKTAQSSAAQMFGKQVSWKQTTHIVRVRVK